MGAGYSKLILNSEYLWRNLQRKKGVFIRFVVFTSTLMYSDVWNQSTIIGKFIGFENINGNFNTGNVLLVLQDLESNQLQKTKLNFTIY